MVSHNSWWDIPINIKTLIYFFGCNSYDVLNFVTQFHAFLLQNSFEFIFSLKIMNYKFMKALWKKFERMLMSALIEKYYKTRPRLYKPATTRHINFSYFPRPDTSIPSFLRLMARFCHLPYLPKPKWPYSGSIHVRFSFGKSLPPHTEHTSLKSILNRDFDRDSATLIINFYLCSASSV